MSERIYVASSWRCPNFERVVDELRLNKHAVYDFKHPDGPESRGFHWSECDVDANGDTAKNYLRGIEHPLAQAGFIDDFSAMQSCDTCVLVLPCNRSAHLELGWFVGRGRRTVVLLDGPVVTPELMYKMVDLITPSLDHVIEWLGVSK